MEAPTLESFEALEKEFAAARLSADAFARDRRRDRGFHVLEKLGSRRRIARLGAARDRWVAFVRGENATLMERDREQWALHARANASEDLQAWYHHTFADELYRLRGPFWWKEAVLPDYASHPIAADVAAQDEPATDAARKALAEKILCSPATIYTAMAATMYTIRSTLAEAEYGLFEKLTTAGVNVTKHPFRSGRPTKKRFQLSLVQGEMRRGRAAIARRPRPPRRRDRPAASTRRLRAQVPLHVSHVERQAGVHPGHRARVRRARHVGPVDGRPAPDGPPGPDGLLPLAGHGRPVAGPVLRGHGGAAALGGHAEGAGDHRAGRPADGARGRRGRARRAAAAAGFARGRGGRRLTRQGRLF